MRQLLANPNRTKEEQELYNEYLFRALGADCMEEAVAIIKSAGI
jgi:hypothetical protein